MLLLRVKLKFHAQWLLGTLHFPLCCKPATHQPKAMAISQAQVSTMPGMVSLDQPVLVPLSLLFAIIIALT